MHFVYQCISFEGDYIHDSLFCLIIYMTSFLGVWFGNTMRAWLYVRTASEAGTRKQQAKVDVSLEKTRERSRRRQCEVALNWTCCWWKRVRWTIMAWVGRLPIPRHATAQYQYKLTTHCTAQHSTMSRQSSSNSTYTCMHVLAQVAVSVCRIYPGYFAGQKRIDRSRKRRTPTHRCRMATDGAEALLLVMHTGLEEKNLTCPMYMLD